jgi:hypothetical protein
MQNICIHNKIGGFVTSKGQFMAKTTASICLSKKMPVSSYHIDLVH